MQEEISALLGKTMTFASPQTKVLTKEDFFSEPAGKSVCAHVNLDGELEGQGCLIVSVKDAIRIGGTLIMLPESELESVIEEEEYTEELEDSYGEIANIICGSLTSTFEEQFPKSFRLVRTEQEVILPRDVDMESDQPVAAGSYYLMSSAMALEGTEMGLLQLLLPAASFGLIDEEAVPEPEKDSGKNSDDVSSPTDSSTNGPPEGDQQQETIERQSVAAEERAEPLEKEERDSEHVSPAAATKKSPQDLKKRKAQIEQLLNNCLARTGEEVGALLGGTLKIAPETDGVFTKEELLDQTSAKQVLARLDVRGQGEGEAYFLVSLKDAIYLGGTLIMLPDAELEEVICNDEFGEDAEDAYGEVANIIAGVYTAIFEEQYRKKFGFVKTDLEVVIPAKVDPDSDEVLPNQIYYLHSGELTFNDKQLGRLQAVFPASLFELETLHQSMDVEEQAAEESGAVRQQAEGSGDETGTDSSRQQEVQGQGAAEAGVGGEGESQSASEAANVLLFTDDDVEAQSIAGILTENGYSPRILHYRDPVGGYLSPSISLVFLVMKEVNEQGFGMAIKLISGGVQVPLVAASPAWTKTTVLKAVKYGAVDILITPASSEDVQEKLDANLERKAA